MIDVGALRMRSLTGSFNDLSPSRNRDTSDVDNRGSFRQPVKQKKTTSVYDPYDPNQPDSPPEEQAPTPGLARIADLSVDPNKRPTVDDDINATKRYIDVVQGSYKPEVRSRDRNDNLLDNFPTRGQPTKMDRAAAILLSLGKPDPAETTEKVLQQDYYRNLADWKTKSDPYYKAAQLENTSNTNERQVLGNALTGFNYNRRTQATERVGDQRYDLGVEANRIRKFIAENPKYKYDFSGPRIIATNENDPDDFHVLGETGKLTEREKLILQGQNAERVARVRATATTDSARIRANAALARGGSGSASRATPKLMQDDAGHLYKFDGNELIPMEDDSPDEPEGNLYTITGKPRAVVDKPMSPAGEKTDYQNDMRRLYDTVSEEDRKFILKSNNGTYYFADRPKPNLFNDNAAAIARYDALKKRIYPDYDPSHFGAGATPNNPPPTPTAPTPTPTPPVGPVRPTPTPQGDAGLRERARQFLASKINPRTGRPYPATEANIQHAIAKRWVQ